MPIITFISGVPLFDNVNEALSWAASNGMTGYHTHNVQNQTGYMGGSNHQQASGMPMNTNAPTPTTTNIPTSSPATRSSGGSSGGSGGY
tara:strand:+ start:247 stop:513 length:267 start_codon:yes stop_codon:yes gene_type:complete